jgi:hypothetical protein
MTNDIEEFNSVMDIATEKLPKMINAIKNTVFSPEAGKAFGEAVGNFYQALVEKGVPEDKATGFAMEYVKALSLVDKIMDGKKKNQS